MTTTLTGSAVIAAAYPARYYAAYDTTAIGITTVTALFDVQSELTTIQKLPAASSMVALTEDQWVLAQNADAIWVKAGALLYPARYYAAYDTAAAQPTSVTGWYDTWALSSVDTVPTASALIPVTREDWADTTAFRLPTGRGVNAGAIVDYTPPAPPVPLKIQAQNALSAARTAVLNDFYLMNKDIPQGWVDYQSALKAIVDGTDATSTQLPAVPT